MTIGSGRRTGITKTIDAEGNENYSCTWDVFITDPEDSVDQISTATGIALFGDSLNYGNTINNAAICSGKSVSPVETDNTKLKRVVTATFTTKTGGRARGGNNVVTNPIAEPWKKGGSFATGTRTTNIDKDGLPCVTSAREPKAFDIPDGYDTLHLEGPSPTMSLSQRAQARVRCNSATIWGLPVRSVLLAQWQWDEMFHGNTSYFYHRLEFWIKYEGWNELWIDEGTQEYIAANPDGERVVPILAINDSLGRNKRFLDGAGRILADASYPAGLVTNTDEVIPEFDFTALTASIGMPNPLPGNFV